MACSYSAPPSAFSYSACFGSIPSARRGWARVPALDTTSLNWEVKAEESNSWAVRVKAERPVKRVRGPAQMAPKTQPPKVVELFQLSSLGFKFVTPTARKAAPQWIPPRTLEIAGVRCPRLGKAMWRPYARRSFESFRSWQSRVRKIVAAFWLGKRIASHNRNLDGSPFEQLMKILKANNLLSLTIFEEELLEEKPIVTGKLRYWGYKKTPKVQIPTCKNKPRGFDFADIGLERKLRLYQLNQSFQSLKKERRQRFLSVVFFENHRPFFLRHQLTNLLVDYGKKLAKADPATFVKDFGIVAEGQMDEPQAKSSQGDAAKTTKEKKSNVVLDSGEGKSVTKPIKPMRVGKLKKIASKDSTKDTRALHDRFITIKQGIWTNEVQGAELFNLTLPKDALEAEDFRNSPNYLMFQTHTYWRGNMILKFMVNANQRQYGQLQLVAYYGADFDKNWPTRDNIFTRSQMPHALVTAPSSNEAELTIPFDFVNPVIRISKGADSWPVSSPGTSDFANMCKFSVRVIIPINAAECTVKRISYSLAIAFEDSHFSGLVDKRIVEYKPTGQMLAMASMYAIKEVMDRIDGNRDNPTVSAVGAPVIPINASSWCAGTNLPEYSNVLRLNPVSCATYPEDRIPAQDEMKIDYIKKIFGLFRILHWDSQYKKGQQLLRFDASPIFDPSNYPTVLKEGRDCYCIPPVGILSSLNCYWTGSLELRIDIVGATECTGRLLVAYVPRYYGQLSIAQAFNCTHAIFSLQSSNRQFVFNIPYVADKMYWDRRKLMTSKTDSYESFEPPGSVYIFVYNELIVNCTIPSDCYLVLYLRGGEDFHVAVPAFPNVALSFNSNVVIPKTAANSISSLDGYFPVFVSSWYQYYDDQTKNHLPILRYGDITDHVAQFKIKGEVDKCLGTYLELSTPVKTYTFSWNIHCFWKEGEVKKDAVALVNFPDCKGVIAVRVGGYIYAVPVFHENFGRCLINWVSADMTLRGLENAHERAWEKFDVTMWGELPFFKEYKTYTDAYFRYADWTTDSDPLKGSNNDRLVAVYKQLTPYPPPTIGNVGEERSSTVAQPVKVIDSGIGCNPALTVFGETFLDLKDYCRRYQLYASGKITVVGDYKVQNFLIKVPIKFQGLPLIVDSAGGVEKDPVANRVREGVIPFIASGYRFAYGGLRFRIVFNNATKSFLKSKIAIQHRPDIIPEDKIVIENIKNIGSNDLILPGYATYYQFDTTNPIISIEIPPYIPIAKVWLQQPSDDYSAVRWGNMGSLALGVSLSTGNSVNYDFEIYYSLADDARFSNFVGFPPMLDITDIPPNSAAVTGEVDEGEYVVVGQMDEEPKTGFFSKFLPFSSTRKAAENLSKIDVDEVNSTISETKTFLQSMKGTIESFVPSLTETKDTLKNYIGVVITAVSNFVHCLLNMSVASVTTAIISLFAQIKLVSIDFMSTMAGRLTDLFSVLKRASNEQTEEASGQMDTEETQEDKYKCAYISTLVAAVAAALSLTPRLFNSDWKSVGIILMDGLKTFAMTANHLFTFIKNNLILINKIANNLVNNSPNLDDIRGLQSTQKDIYDWCVDAIETVDPRMEMELFSNIRKASKIHLLAARGNVILLSLGKVKVDPKQYSIIRDLFNRVEKLRSRLTKMHLAPPVRFEPGVVEVTGKTGCGKTKIVTTNLAQELMNHLNLKHDGELIYTRQLGNPHWNNCRNQPIFFVDEKFPIAKQGFDDVQIAELFMLKSRCIFNPLMADLPDKDLRYNPILAFYCSNNPFPKLTGVLDHQAINRRRDILVRMRWTEEIYRKYHGNRRRITLNMLTAAERKDWKCSEFSFKNDVIEDDNNWSAYFNYEEFLNRLKNWWFDYYLTEQAIFEENLKAAFACYPKEGEDGKNIDTYWLEMLDNKLGEPQDRKFKRLYRELVTLESYKKSKDSERVVSFCKIFQNVFSKSVAPDDELLASIEKVKLEMKELYQREATLAQGCSEYQDVVGPNKPSTSNSMVDVQFTIKKKVEEKQNYCVHEFLLDLMKTKGHVSYNSDYNGWVASVTALESFCNYVLTNGVITVDQYFHSQKHKKVSLKDIPLNPTFDFFLLPEDEIFIPHSVCSSSNCIWKDEVIRKNFMMKVYENDKIAQNLVAKFNFKNLGNLFPLEFVKFIGKDFSESTTEEIQSWKQRYLEKISFVRNWYDRIRESFFKIEWKKWFQRLAILMGVFFFLGALFKIWAFGSSAALSSETAGTLIACRTAALLAPDSQAHSSGDFRTGSRFRPNPKTIVEKTIANLGSKIDYTLEALRKNTIFISMYSSNLSIAPIVGKCLGICGLNVLVVDHYWEAWQNFGQKEGTNDLHVYFVSDTNPRPISVSFDDLVYKKISNSALGMIEFKPKSKIKPFKDIRKLIANRETHSYTNGLGTIVEWDVDVDCKRVLRLVPDRDYSLRSSLYVKGGSLYSDYTTGQIYQYFGFSGKGKCGSLLINESLISPIIGMHTAGAGEIGYSEAIYREMFDSLGNVVSAQADIGSAGDSNWFVDGETVGIGKVATKFAHRANEKSLIEASFIQRNSNGEFPVFTQPAVLSPKDPRLTESFSPMLEGCKHHGKPLLKFNSEHLKLAIEDYQNVILAKNKPARTGVGLLSRDLAIGGIPSIDGYQHIEWNSSEGFPFVGLRPPGYHNKRWLFNFDEEGHYLSCKRLLESKLNATWQLRNNKIIPDTVFTDCLKDCTVEHSKVLQPGKTRIFSIAPVDFTIHQRQCTLDFIVAFMKNRLDLEHAIGINPDSEEWTRLTYKLLSRGDNIATGDYSKFGDTIPPEIIHAFYETIAKWYLRYGELTEEHANQLEIMPFEIANSLHLMFDHIYQVVCGQPSGNSATVCINSFANSIYIRLAWLDIMKGTRYNSLDQLHKHVKFYSYGDDIIIALSEEIKELFNAEILAYFFSLHKLKFTNADKGDNVVKYTNIMKADFLKRGFTYHPERKPLMILAPLSPVSIEDTVNWITKESNGRSLPNSKYFVDMSLQVSEDALRNAFGRGEKYYEQFKSKLQTFWQKHGEIFLAPSWRQWDVRIFDLGENINEYSKASFFSINQKEKL